MDEFTKTQQVLALQVARLPILRNELRATEKMVKDGFLGSAAIRHQRMEYEACVRWIRTLASNI